MARVQLIIPDDDRDRFLHQARLEGMTFSAWLRAAALHRLEENQASKALRSPEDLEGFFHTCDELDGPDREPDWEDHLETINDSRGNGQAAR